ncbi:asparagine synthase (glutamine-hydrolyzing) [Dictyobacter aurantiacus]|uniref:asparagine synthase (glutamine-hydrolyzing) n=1 Tax=Dictyobacter aurantiacus TaxID=1936993 RepID=A0A401ZKM5_9CHLR|nr:asparagine synthase (glutamine-hydrolyzing) [Dictyobacter aurantiacus]GCE07409.1 asparagine synthetase B [Dictyobacter aurantiacus]
MCGITGWIDWEEDVTRQGAILETMAATMRYRGPDAKGIWLTPRVAFAHRRLMVIDPAGGAQPMAYTSGSHTYAITYNGEIYNFRELRGELETRGHTFSTKSDTEVILHAYVEWGEDFTRRLNGIFAFALWDEQRQRLLLARDHLGVKPLFYAQRGSAVIFGSELKALLAHPRVQPEVDRDGMADILGASIIRTPGFGYFHDVHEVRPGYQLIFERERTRVNQYWSLRSAPHPDDVETTTQRIRDLLKDTVKRQLIADVPVVSMLSGGLDSSGLTALAAEEFRREGRQLETYSIDFVESDEYFTGNDMRPSLDAPWVTRVAEHAMTRHHTVTVDTPELLENLLVPLYAHDVPAMGQIETSLYLIFKAMKEQATVALSGESADEVFGGYPWYHYEEILNINTFPWLAMMRRRRSLSSPPRLLSEEVMQKVSPFEYIARRYQEALAEVPRLEGEDAEEARRREIMYMGLTRWLPLLLDRKDRMSMAVGFEVRVPFCDYRLVEYVWNIPWQMKTVDNIEKGILRRALQGILPDDARMRRKSAYPSSQHPSYIKGVCDWALQILNDPNAAVRPYINVDTYRAFANKDNPVLGQDFGIGPLERLIQLETWLKEYHIRFV